MIWKQSDHRNGNCACSQPKEKIRPWGEFSKSIKAKESGGSGREDQARPRGWRGGKQLRPKTVKRLPSIEQFLRWTSRRGTSIGTAMLLPRIFAPVRASSVNASISIVSSSRVLDAFRAANASTSPSLSFIRHATHQAQGRANGAKDGPGKRLGAKKSGGTPSLSLPTPPQP